MKKALTIAGSDSGAGAGIQADLKTLAAFGVYGTSVITALTAQNTQGVQEIFKIPVDFVCKQIDVIMQDIHPYVWKTGMLVNEKIVEMVVERAKYYKIKNLIIDPVLISKNNKVLLSTKALHILIKKLIPQAFIITPNIPEAEIITGHKINNIDDMKKVATIIYQMGAKNVLIKGGHLDQYQKAIDILYDGKNYCEFVSERIKTKNLHGTGCTYASAIAAGIAKKQTVIIAVKNAKKYLNRIIVKSKHLHIGNGNGPLNHFLLI